LDLIGDYLTCRPFFSALRKEEKWKDHSFTFAGNQQVKTLAESLDSEVFDDFIWIDRARFINSWGYRLSILKKVRKAGFELVLYPSHTRQFWLESVVRVSGAPGKWTPKAIGQYMSAFEKNLCDPGYSAHLETGGPVLFEFYRNRNFFGHFSKTALEVQKLSDHPSAWATDKNRSDVGLIAVAPGASTPQRQWPVSYFGELISRLAKTGPFQFVVVGGPAEKELGEELLSLLPNVKIENLAGKMTLLQSFEYIKQVHLLISNESGPVHMAATTGTPCVCISQGNHFGRWNPYPQEVAPEIATVYPASFGNVKDNFESLSNLYHNGSTVDVSQIGVDLVFQAAYDLLQRQGFQL